MNGGGLVDSYSLHVSEIEIACEYQAATGDDCHLGWKIESESGTVLRVPRMSGWGICGVCHRGEGGLGHQACKSRGRGQRPETSLDHHAY